MDVWKDSNGNFGCKGCQTIYMTFQEAADCAKMHKSLEDGTIKPLVSIGAAEANMQDYRNAKDKDGTIAVAEKLIMSMIEDYEFSRQTDLMKTGKPGALTMNLANNAINALNLFNRVVYGDRSTRVNINTDGKKKTDLDAIKDLLTGHKTIEADAAAIEEGEVKEGEK